MLGILVTAQFTVLSEFIDVFSFHFKNVFDFLEYALQKLSDARASHGNQIQVSVNDLIKLILSKLNSVQCPVNLLGFLRFENHMSSPVVK